MPRNNSDDEYDSCVLLGTPLIDLLPEDAKFSVKPKRPEEQIVTDEKGRQRFHGAFTGGYSAGYFNTVGSKEGWAPSTFKSSRSDKSDNKSYLRPEDFMDEEDFDDHGIAPKNLKIKSDYKDQSNQKDTNLAPKHNTAAFLLDDLVKPVQNTIGVRMLRKMGWRQGQGIGPKIKRKLRKLKSKLNYEPGRKIYGVALPSESDGSANEELEDDYFVSTFDVNDFQFDIKEDLFGLGYKRLDVGNLFGKPETLVEESPAASLLFPMAANQIKNNKKGMSGHAFGVGEYEDEDDVDVYKQDNMETYDFELNSSRQKDAKKLLNKSYGFGAFENDVTILKQYVQSKKKLEPSKVFQAQQVPSNFNLMHKFARASRFEDEKKNENDPMSSYLKSVSDRAEILGENNIQPDSVFDLVSSRDREFLKEQKLKLNKDLVKLTPEPGPEPEPEEVKPRESDKEKKANRYESFVSFMKKSYKDAYSFVDTKDLTEWEKEKEKDEFTGRYQDSIKRLELIKKDNLKFVSTSTLNENNQEIDLSKEEKQNLERKQEISKASSFIDKDELTDMHKAALENKFGKLTRSEYEWRPHPVLCKRFNIPNPHTDTKEYGTVKDENDKRKTPKFSLFNLMTSESRFDKEKPKNLFDEINADMPLKQGPSNVKTVNLPKNPNDEDQENKIEFENKKIDESSKQVDFAKTFHELDAKAANTVKETENTNNVYLQERPDFDLFKAIFEDDEEEVEEVEEAITEDLPEEIKSDSDEPREEMPKITFVDPKKRAKPETSILSSSIKDIDIVEVNKYLKSDELDEPTEMPEAVKFTKLLKNLASKKSKKSEKSSTESSSSSSSESDSDIEEIVYEEVSISNKDEKKKSHKKSHKKKKKHHRHKKNSKKSHKTK